MTTNAEPSIAHHTLSQGTRLATVHRPGTKSFYLTLALPVGWKDDPPGTPGVAHFLEHLMFAGSNRPVIERLADQAVRYQATTSQDSTNYSFSGHLDLLPEVLEFVRGIFTPFRYEQEEIDTERGVIARELIDRRPESLHKRNFAYDRYWACLNGSPNFWDDRQAYEALPGIDLDLLRRFHMRRYRTSNAVVSLCSPLDHAETAHEIERTLPDQSDLLPEDQAREQSPIGLPPVSFSHDRAKNVWVYIDTITDDLSLPMDLIVSAICSELGGGAHAIMQQEFHRKEGRAYHATTYLRYFAQHTSFGAMVSVAKKNALSSAEFLAAELDRFASQSLTAESLGTTAQRFARWSEMVYDRPDQLLGFLTHWLLRHRHAEITPAEQATAAADLTVDEARSLAAKLLAPENLTMFVGGPISWWERGRFRRLMQRG